MGMFDTVVVRCDLPIGAPEFVVRNPVFQTYDLGRGMNDYEITKEKRLVITNSVLCGFLLEAITGKNDVDQIATPVDYKRKKIKIFASNLRGSRNVGKKKRRVKFTKNGEPCVEIEYVVQIRNGFVSSIKELWRTEEPAWPMSRF